jgi:molybdenum cofactor synthesis domain-containing protein
MLCTFEIICVGNELLIGKILNTNAQWLAKHITTLGGTLQRITVVGDTITKIASAITESISRNPAFIITTGGLGPTFDDKTIEAAAMAYKKPLELNTTAYQMIKEKYHTYETATQTKIELTPARLKMAKLPEGSRPLPNPVGTAPGVLTDFSSSKIIHLPGVPSEMKAIFKQSVIQLIKRVVGTLYTYEVSLKLTGIIESELAPLIDRVMQETPHVYIKSHPQAAEPIPLIELHLSSSAESKKLAEHRVRIAETHISSLVVAYNGQLSPIELHHDPT